MKIDLSAQQLYQPPENILEQGEEPWLEDYHLSTFPNILTHRQTLGYLRGCLQNSIA